MRRWRCGSRPSGAPTRPWRHATAAVGARARRHRRYHAVRPGGAQPALPLRRHAGRGARDRGAHPHRLQPTRAVRCTGCSATRGSPTVGRCSYSLYLWHIVPMLLLEKAGLRAAQAGARPDRRRCDHRLTVLSYRLLERPFLRPRSDVLRPRRVPASATVGRAPRAGRAGGSARQHSPRLAELVDQVVGRGAGRVEADPVARPRARWAAPSDRRQSRSAKNSRTGASGPTSSPGAQSRTSAGSSCRV